MENNPKLNVVVVFHNGLREANRTLYSLSNEYQKHIQYDDYIVTVIDSNSSVPLGEELVKSFGSNYYYLSVKTNSPSPAYALNIGLNENKCKYIMPMIDGARMLSPGVLVQALQVLNNFDKSMPYVVSYDLGEFRQNYSMIYDYNQAKEDLLLDGINWRENGYELFKVSNYCQSKNLFSKVIESNCFALEADLLNQIGGFDERFTSAGGGLLNLDVFSTLIQDVKLTPVCIIGEATFHQYHGGVSSNVLMDRHPVHDMNMEYFYIKGKHYLPPNYLPFYWGGFNKTTSYLKPKSKYESRLELIDELYEDNLFNDALSLLDYFIKKHPAQRKFYLKKISILISLNELQTAEDVIEQALKFNPKDVQILLAKGKLYEQKNDSSKANEIYITILEIDPYEPTALYEIYLYYKNNDNIEEAQSALDRLVNNSEKLRGTYPAINVAKLLIKQKTKLDLAKVILERALQYAPEDAEIRKLFQNI